MDNPETELNINKNIYKLNVDMGKKNKKISLLTW